MEPEPPRSHPHSFRLERCVLVFTRKKGESLIIGNEIEVSVLSISGGNVKVGISAPRQISVHRLEVFEAIQRENQAASSSQFPPSDVLKKFIR